MDSASSENLQQGGNAQQQRPVQPRFRSLLWLLWILILLKCIVLQWAADAYDMPINTWLYVWTPSLVFALLCTVVYRQFNARQRRQE